MQTCRLCRGRLESTTTTVTRETGGGRVQVQGVPVDRCVDCGEEWFRARDLKAVEAMIAANAGADTLVYKAPDDTWWTAPMRKLEGLELTPGEGLVTVQDLLPLLERVRHSRP